MGNRRWFFPVENWPVAKSGWEATEVGTLFDRVRVSVAKSRLQATEIGTLFDRVRVSVAKSRLQATEIGTLFDRGRVSVAWLAARGLIRLLVLISRFAMRLTGVVEAIPGS